MLPTILTISSDYRITLPLLILKNTSYTLGGYLKIKLQKGEAVGYLYLRTPQNKSPTRKHLQIRRKLSRDIIKKLSLLPNETIRLTSIEEISQILPPTYKGEEFFDLLSLPFNKGMIELFLEKGEEWIRFWHSSKYGGRGKEATLKRFIKIDRSLGELFGLMQAESRKDGSKFDFTNILISEHKKFVNVCETFGLSKENWKLGIIYNPSFSEEQVEFYKNKFLNQLSINFGYKTKSSTITTVAYTIYIDNTTLNKIMLSLLRSLRSFAAERIENCWIEFSRGFVAKELLGDGTILNHIRGGIRVILSEEDPSAQNDFVRILSKFKIKANTIKNVVHLQSDFESNCWFFKNQCFVGTFESRKRLIRYLLRNSETNLLMKRFSRFSRPVTAAPFAKLNHLSIPTARMYLHRNAQRGLIKKVKQEDKTLYFLTQEAISKLEIIDAAEKEYFQHHPFRQPIGLS
ncbi:MAG: hypothetical protein WC595_04210 [Candidatus Nanoarchaeia archaeon]